MIATGWRERGIRNDCLMGTEFQFYKMKRVMEIHGGDGFTTL